MEFGRGCNIGGGNDDTQDQEAENDSCGAKIRVKFEHWSNTYACPIREFHTGESAYKITTATDYGFIRPDRSRDHCKSRKPDRLTMGKIVGVFKVSYSRADQPILINTTVDRFEMFLIIETE